MAHNVQKMPKKEPQQVLLNKVMLFTVASKIAKYLGHFVRKFVAKKFQNSSNMVTLLLYITSGTGAAVHFFKKWAITGLFFIYFLRRFKQTLQYLLQINVEKWPFSV